ncbi:GPW/gp25 family protein [Serratia marcescens]|uniref:Gene 25-like lysozyme n=1 Tax=Serratia marcescens TaxID=615 RepID=A0A1C3HHN0_SERMA|nr:GPW/gp25 family protein [Serratia marcescens]MDN0028146.1 GPW/gp25 family protein [Serratia marcescens]OJH83045.1 putative bacteriophage baseplate protein [Serratia marcescens]SAY44560.1 Gene 25-like lysozyme [Serratia marcescens]HDW3810958.1 GPW/gp25 family protein [Klebsiella pneumoniae]
MKTENATSVYWQPALYRPGERVTGLADIHQSIQIILGTPCGADPHRPDFGSNIYRYIDQPVDQALPHVVRETTDALRRYEPRAEVVSVSHRAEGEHAWLQVQWRPVGAAWTETTEVTWR